MVHDNMGVLIGGQGERQQTSKDSVWSLDPGIVKLITNSGTKLNGRPMQPDFRLGEYIFHPDRPAGDN